MTRLRPWLASFRLRILFRTAFLLLAAAVLAMAVAVLQEEKQRSYDNYRAGFGKTKEHIVARLRHPSGQLALLNPRWNALAATAGRPLVLPYATLDFDDQNKVRSAIETAGCLVPYADGNRLCVAIGNNPWAGGFIYAAGTFIGAPLDGHRIGDEYLDGAHRLRVTVDLRDRQYRWLAPFEPLPAPVGGNGGLRGRFTGYVEQDGRDYTGARPVREFRGWVWQDSQCSDAGETAGAAPNCRRATFYSLRLPVDALRDALFRREKPIWPPPDLDAFRVRIEVLPPGDGPALFDNRRDRAIPGFALDELGELLLPGESLTIERTLGAETWKIAHLTGHEQADSRPSPFLTRLIRILPVASLETPEVELSDDIDTPLGAYRLHLHGDARSVNKTLSAVATRVSWFVGAMLGAIGLAWLVIEIGIIGRIARLTRRTRGLAQTVHAEAGLERYQLADLRGADELGLLATGLDQLLRRVKEDAEREKIRAEQEKDLWHAVGHEIMSPLQSLLALHGNPDDPSHRYIGRMQQAVRILYGSASPSEAFQSSNLSPQTLDIAAFLHQIADNAADLGIAAVQCPAGREPVPVRADEYPLEDVFSHLLKNADRYRVPGSPIVLDLETAPASVAITVTNHGPRIPAELIERIFEYGVSDQPDAGAHGNRGQGLFVVKTYLAKMGGTVAVRNLDDGVRFTLTLQRSA